MTGNLHGFFFLFFFIHMNSNYLFGYKYKGFDNSNQTWHARSIGGGGGWLFHFLSQHPLSFEKNT